MDSSPETDAFTTPPTVRPNDDDDDGGDVEEEEVEEEEEEEADIGDDDDDDAAGSDDEEDNDDEDDASPPTSSASAIIRAVPTLASLSHLRDLSQDAISWTLSSAKPGNGVEQVIYDPSVETYWQSDGGQPHIMRVFFGRRVAVSHVCLYLEYNLDESYTPKTLMVRAGMTIQDLQNVVVHTTTPTTMPGGSVSVSSTTVELHQPTGWCILPLQAPQDPLDAMLGEDDDEDHDHDGSANNEQHQQSQRPRRPVRTHLVEIRILAMHQNGRDTHVRRVKLFGPKRGTYYHNGSNSSSGGVVRMTTTHNEQTKATNRHGYRNNHREVVLLDQTPNYSTVAMTQFNTIR